MWTKEYKKKYEHNWYLKHKKQVLISSRNRYHENHDEYIENARQYTRKRRLQLLETVGKTKCINCGIKDPRVLHLDHIDGKGNLDKKRFSGSSHRLGYYIRNPKEAKKTLQILCANCHSIKTYENGDHVVR